MFKKMMLAVVMALFVSTTALAVDFQAGSLQKGESVWSHYKADNGGLDFGQYRSEFSKANKVKNLNAAFRKLQPGTYQFPITVVVPTKEIVGVVPAIEANSNQAMAPAQGEAQVVASLAIIQTQNGEIRATSAQLAEELKKLEAKVVDREMLVQFKDEQIIKLENLKKMQEELNTKLDGLVERLLQQKAETGQALRLVFPAGVVFIAILIACLLLSLSHRDGGKEQFLRLMKEKDMKEKEKNAAEAADDPCVEMEEEIPTPLSFEEEMARLKERFPSEMLSLCDLQEEIARFQNAVTLNDILIRGLQENESSLKIKKGELEGKLEEAIQKISTLSAVSRELEDLRAEYAEKMESERRQMTAECVRKMEEMSVASDAKIRDLEARLASALEAGFITLNLTREEGVMRRFRKEIFTLPIVLGPGGKKLVQVPGQPKMFVEVEKAADYMKGLAKGGGLSTFMYDGAYHAAFISDADEGPDFSELTIEPLAEDPDLLIFNEFKLEEPTESDQPEGGPDVKEK